MPARIEPLAHGGVAQRDAVCSASGSARTPVHSGSRSNGSRVANDSSTLMPRQCDWPIMRPPTAAMLSMSSSIS